MPLHIVSLPIFIIFGALLGLTGPNQNHISTTTSDASALEATFVLQQTPAQVRTENPCPEGQFLNLQTEACQPLDKSFGFDADIFAENIGTAEFTLEECTDDALQELLDAVEGTGGTVTIPACTMQVDRKLFVPSNVVLQGAGVGQTVLQTDASFDETVLQVRHASNVIVRDITLDGGGGGHLLLSSWYADNVLFERIEARNARGTGINFRYTQRITIRYSSSRNNGTWHGIASKDCFPGDEEQDDIDECIAQFEEKADEVAETPGVLWSENFAIYSNNLSNNGGYGLDLHASRGEVAGNLMENNGYGSKFPDSSNLWIHHNRISGNRWWGTFLYGTVDIEERASRQLLFYANTFGRNGILQMRIHAPVRDVYLMLNEYTSFLNARYVSGAQLYLCQNGADTRVFTYGTRPIGINPTQCTLENASTVFSD